MNKSPGLLLVAMAAAFAAVGCSKTPDATATTPAAQAVVAKVPDIDVTEHVTTALHQKGLGKGLDLKVGTLNGEVRLDGMLDNQAQVDEAVRIARASDGVHTVHNHLTIRK
jgi:osmotically-inducible protein OsmY